MFARLRSFFVFFDSRFEDLTRDNWKSVIYRDLSAGLIVALTAIPMAMGFAMAMGLRPEQGIIAGAVACLVGRTFGGSKYQVYGPTAAFIPVIAALMSKYGEQGHALLVFVSILAGVVLMLLGVAGLGTHAKRVPNAIIAGFTIGIAIAIAKANFAEATVSGVAIAIALGTFAVTKLLLRISIFIPAPLIAIGGATWLSSTVLEGKLMLVRDKFGAIPNDFFVFTPPRVPEMTLALFGDIVYFVLAIVFVSGVESLLCSSMADRLAHNKRTPFNPDKEFWGQGLVQIITPLLNGFPCTGALARTATSIKAGAVTPLAGYFKGVLKLILAYYLAGFLEHVPLACIAGILFWVASNMIKLSEIREILKLGLFDSAIMVYTAVMVPATDFLTAVASALLIYAAVRFAQKRSSRFVVGAEGSARGGTNEGCP